jgi:hypothetical protein
MSKQERNMNHILFKYSGIFVVLSACVLFLGGCTAAGLTIAGKSAHDPPQPGVDSRKNGPPPWAPAHGYRAKHKYRYYHDAEVYYDIDKRVYFYYRGGQWQVSVTFPTRVHIDMNRYVTLEMDSDKPYRHHKDVVKKYPPGQLKKASKSKKNKN